LDTGNEISGVDLTLKLKKDLKKEYVQSRQERLLKKEEKIRIGDIANSEFLLLDTIPKLYKC